MNLKRRLRSFLWDNHYFPLYTGYHIVAALYTSTRYRKIYLTISYLIKKKLEQYKVIYTNLSHEIPVNVKTLAATVELAIKLLIVQYQLPKGQFLEIYAKYIYNIKITDILNYVYLFHCINIIIKWILSNFFAYCWPPYTLSLKCRVFY